MLETMNVSWFIMVYLGVCVCCIDLSLFVASVMLAYLFAVPDSALIPLMMIPVGCWNVGKLSFETWTSFQALLD